MTGESCAAWADHPWKGSLGDDFYLITHDDQQGQLRAPAEPTRFGLATALIAELMLSDHLRVWQDGLYSGKSTTSLGRSLAGSVLAKVADPGRERLIGTWIRVLAVRAITDVQRRLLMEDVLTEGVKPGLFGLGRRVIYPPKVSTDAAWPGIRIARQLSYGEPVSLHDGVLVGILMATGLLPLVLWDPVTHAQGTERAIAIYESLPPPMRVLLQHAESCTANAVLTALR